MKTGFFEEAPGVRSMTRLVTLIMTLLLCYTVIVGIHRTGVDLGLVALLGSFALGVKMGGRYLEDKGGAA
jgi:hypothetical protein